MERGECAYGRGDTLGVVALEGCEVAVSGVYAGEVGEEVAGDDVGEGGGVGVFVQDVLLVQAPGPAGGGPLCAGGGAGQQRMCVRAQQSVAWHRGAGGGGHRGGGHGGSHGGSIRVLSDRVQRDEERRQYTLHNTQITRR